MQHFRTVNIHVNHRRSGRGRLFVLLVTDSSLAAVSACLESLPTELRCLRILACEVPKIFAGAADTIGVIFNQGYLGQHL